MTEQKTYDYKGTKLIKVPDKVKGECIGCFFEHRKTCDGTGIDDRNGISCLTDGWQRDYNGIIFIEAKNESVNKID